MFLIYLSSAKSSTLRKLITSIFLKTNVLLTNKILRFCTHHSSGKRFFGEIAQSFWKMRKESKDCVVSNTTRRKRKESDYSALSSLSKYQNMDSYIKGTFCCWFSISSSKLNYRLEYFPKVEPKVSLMLHNLPPLYETTLEVPWNCFQFCWSQACSKKDLSSWLQMDFILCFCWKHIPEIFYCWIRISLVKVNRNEKKLKI